jgi:hypothetical protein
VKICVQEIGPVKRVNDGLLLGSDPHSLARKGDGLHVVSACHRLYVADPGRKLPNEAFIWKCIDLVKQLSCAGLGDIRSGAVVGGE